MPKRLSTRDPGFDAAAVSQRAAYDAGRRDGIDLGFGERPIGGSEAEAEGEAARLGRQSGAG